MGERKREREGVRKRGEKKGGEEEICRRKMRM